MLASIQQTLFERALKHREDNTREITTEGEFREFFTPKQKEGEPEIHGGFALCHFADEQDLEPLLKELKVTPRCIPLDQENQPGKCFATGKPTDKQAVFAKAY